MAQAAQRFTQTIPEEFCNGLSHAMGAGMALSASIPLVARAIQSGQALTVLSMVIYCVSLVALLSFSALYHAILPSRTKAVFQVIDHCSIYLLIVGTYTPISLCLIGGTVGWVIFGIVAGCAVLGITLNCVGLHRFHRISMALYLISGWTAVMAFGPLSQLLTPLGWTLLLGGGVMYTAGVIFYRDKVRRYRHFIWHLFVLAGALLHFLFVYYCCL